MKWTKAKVGEYYRSSAGTISTIEVHEGGKVTLRGHVLKKDGHEIYRTDKGLKLLKTIAETLHGETQS